MYDHTMQRDYYQAEAEYRRGRARAEIGGRRIRRALTRRDEVGRGDTGDWTITSAR